MTMIRVGVKDNVYGIETDGTVLNVYKFDRLKGLSSDELHEMLIAMAYRIDYQQTCILERNAQIRALGVEIGDEPPATGEQPAWTWDRWSIFLAKINAALRRNLPHHPCPSIMSARSRMCAAEWEGQIDSLGGYLREAQAEIVRLKAEIEQRKAAALREGK